MTKLEKFKKNVSPRKRVSKLNQYEEEIQELLNDRYTHQRICEYLQQAYNVEVSRQYLSSYIQIKKNINVRQNNPSKPKNQQSISEKDKVTAFAKKMGIDLKST